MKHKPSALSFRHWPLGHSLDSLLWVCEHSGSHPRMALHSGLEIGVPTRKQKGDDELVSEFPPYRNPHSLITSGPVIIPFIRGVQCPAAHIPSAQARKPRVEAWHGHKIFLVASNRLIKAENHYHRNKTWDYMKITDQVLILVLSDVQAWELPLLKYLGNDGFTSPESWESHSNGEAPPQPSTATHLRLSQNLTARDKPALDTHYRIQPWKAASQFTWTARCYNY